MTRVSWPEEVVARFLDDQFRLQQRHFALHHEQADDCLVTLDSAPIGRLVVDRTVQPWLLVEIALSVDAQGHGWGSALLGWLQQEARAKDADGIDLHVAYDNPRAAAFYRRLGFAAVAGAAAATHRRLLWNVS